MQAHDSSTILHRQGQLLCNLALLEKAQASPVVTLVRFLGPEAALLTRADGYRMKLAIDTPPDALVRRVGQDGYVLSPALHELPETLPEQDSIHALWGEALWDCGTYVDQADDFMGGDMQYKSLEHDYCSVLVVAEGRDTLVERRVVLGHEEFPMALPVDLATDIMGRRGGLPQ